MALKFCLFADLHYKKGGYIITTADMEAILDRAAANDAEFMIHCGDFCNDYAGSPELLRLAYENKYVLALYGVYGNHELESEPKSPCPMAAIPGPNGMSVPIRPSIGATFAMAFIFRRLQFGVLQIMRRGGVTGRPL